MNYRLKIFILFYVCQPVKNDRNAGTAKRKYLLTIVIASLANSLAEHFAIAASCT